MTKPLDNKWEAALNEIIKCASQYARFETVDALIAWQLAVHLAQDLVPFYGNVLIKEARNPINQKQKVSESITRQWFLNSQSTAIEKENEKLEMAEAKNKSIWCTLWSCFPNKANHKKDKMHEQTLVLRR